MDSESLNLLESCNLLEKPLKFYDKIIYNGILYGTEKRSISIKTDDSFVQLSDGCYGQIKVIFNNDVFRCVISVYASSSVLSLESEYCHHMITLKC